jgi:hypothetical protein
MTLGKSKTSRVPQYESHVNGVEFAYTPGSNVQAPISDGVFNGQSLKSRLALPGLSVHYREWGG